MRTGRSLTVCWRLLRGGCLPASGGSDWSRGGVGVSAWSGEGVYLVLGGCLPGRGCLVWGVCLVTGGGGVCLVWGGVYLVRGDVYLVGGCLPGPRGGVWSGGSWHPSMHWGRSPLWTESQTPVKTLPWPNFFAAGKYLPMRSDIESVNKRSSGWSLDGDY